MYVISTQTNGGIHLQKGVLRGEEQTLEYYLTKPFTHKNECMR